MKRKGFLCGVLAFCLTLTLTACGNSGQSNNSTTSGNSTGGNNGGESIRIRVAHVCGTGAPFDYGAQEFKKLVEERSDGRISVEVFAGDMTTDEVEAVEMVQNNNLEIAWVSTGSISGFVPELGIFQLPFLFENLEHVEAAISGEFGQTIIEKVSAVDGLTAIGFHEDGWRNILTNNVPINSVEDMKGVRMRAMMDPVCVAMYESMGAIPISLASGEQFTGLQNGVVDGTDNSALYAKADGYIEAVNCICDIHHFYASGIIVCSQSWFSGLSAEDQELIQAAAQEAGAAQRAWFLDADEALIAEYEEKGYTVTRPTDIDAWKAATQSTYDKMYAEHPDWEPLVEMIQNVKP